VAKANPQSSQENNAGSVCTLECSFMAFLVMNAVPQTAHVHVREPPWMRLCWLRERLDPNSRPHTSQQNNDSPLGATK
jgi:hypothetical protein